MSEMDLDKQIKELEAQKQVLEITLKELKIKEAQVLKIKQLKDDISKLNSDIKTVQGKVDIEEK